jgi:integral membrane sensor domain MASE1
MGYKQAIVSAVKIILSTLLGMVVASQIVTVSKEGFAGIIAGAVAGGAVAIVHLINPIVPEEKESKAVNKILLPVLICAFLGGIVGAVVGFIIGAVLFAVDGPGVGPVSEVFRWGATPVGLTAAAFSGALTAQSILWKDA